MCLNLFAYKSHPKYDLVIAANRDEFYERPTLEAHFWDDYPAVLAGRDMLHSGTWLGVNKNGRFAFITNYRDFSLIKPDGPSRGALVSNYLNSEQTPKAYLENINTPKSYSGFNLVVGDLDTVFYLSNVKGGSEPINSGLHGVSNAFMDTPWHKVELGKNCLQNVIMQDEFAVDELFDMLGNREQAPKDKLPQTGLPIEMEKAVSSMFIKSPNYGTVCSTVVLIDKKGNVHFEERVTNPLKDSKVSQFNFQIES